MALQAVTLNEIDQIFAVIEPLGISREAVVIPLRPESPGRVSRMSNGKYEIVVDAEVPIAEWLPTLDLKLRELLEVG